MRCHRFVRYGSSPLAWGTARRASSGSRPCGFIPTRVGNSIDLIGVSSGGPVHPHSRGEQHHNISSQARRIGSSPLAWGTAAQLLRGAGGERFIPTRVGNSSIPSRRGRPFAVHPHSRGEQETGHHQGHRRAVHPHSRGEQATWQSYRCSMNGSSPLAWGTV